MIEDSPYFQITLDLLVHWQFRLLLTVIEYAAVLAAVFIVCVIVLHLIFMQGYRVILYRKRSPIRGWTRRLVVVGLFVIAALLLVAYGIAWLLRISV